MHLSEVRLSNIACFEDISIDFTGQVSGKPASWIVLLGENGTGKSTLLQMIGAALLAQNQFAVIAGDVNWRGYIRDQNSSEKARIWLQVQPEAGDVGYLQGQSSLETFFYLRDQGQDRFPPHPSPGPYMYDSPLAPLYDDSLSGGWFACGYSPWRRPTRRLGADKGAIPTLEDSAKPFRFASLFGDGAGLTDVSEWLSGLYFRSIYPDRTDADEKRFGTAKSALLRTMPRVKSLKVTQDRQVLVSHDRVEVPIERLSDGYRGTLAWVGDLIRRLFDAYPDSPNPLRQRGVVLVDEIDLHLHPRWQRTVVEDVRALFPNIQFIVTTHSPFVAQDLRIQDKIIVLDRAPNGKSVVVREGAGAVQNWSADQILSGYFGLSSGTRGEEALREEARYERLLDAEAAGELTQKMKADLEFIHGQVNLMPIGDTPDEQAIFRAIGNATAAVRRRRESLANSLGTAEGEDNVGTQSINTEASQ